jgi:HK97 family phage portal protein
MKFNMNTLDLSIKAGEEKDKSSSRGSWNSNVQTRRRKGLHPIQGIYTPNFYNNSVSVGGNSYRQLSDDQLWTVYIRNADVRACVDSIVRRVATFDWYVRPIVSPTDDSFKLIDESCTYVRDFLNKPNKNNETWQELMTSLLTDVLVYDNGIIELVKNRNNELTELVALDASTINVVVDEFGRIKEYIQTPYETTGVMSTDNEISYVRLKKENILQLSIYSNTKNPTGNPVLEALLNEVIALLNASEHLMYALSADEIPPGILVLSGISGNAAREAQADLQRLKNQDHKIRVMTTPDPNGVGAKWLELRHTPKDLEMKSLIDDVRRSVFRCFGVMPVEMGLTDGMPRATATVQLDVASSHLVTPIVELLQAKINNIILPLIVKDVSILKKMRFGFDRDARLTTTEKYQLSQTHTNYVRIGVLTRNEVRKDLGFLPEEGGDILSFDSNLGPIPVSTLSEGGSAILVGQHNLESKKEETEDKDIEEEEQENEED